MFGGIRHFVSHLILMSSDFRYFYPRGSSPRDHDERAFVQIRIKEERKKRWKVTGHPLRHSAATWYANETDLDIHQLKRQLGHSKLETTMKYVHAHEQSRKRALQQAWHGY